MGDPTKIDSPMIVWIGIGIGALILIATGIPKIVGPLKSMVEEWTASARRTHAARDDADIAELNRQVGNMSVQIAELTLKIDGMRAYQGAHDLTLSEHRQWDLDVLERAARSGIALPPPPPLYPPEVR